jgi:predicted house-cleaning noncanonical NTP pyrophosphatase (MazG superfamily)
MYILPILSIYLYKKDWEQSGERRRFMARGQRKSIEEKIAAKEELIEALTTRLESEKRELEELCQEKKRKELEVVSDIIAESGLEPEEVAAVLQQYLENREEAAS